MKPPMVSDCRFWN